MSPFIGELRELVTRRSAGAVLLAETNVPPEELATFVGMHNLGEREVVIRTQDLGLGSARLITLFGEQGDTLGRYGYRWARVDNGK